MCALQLSFFGVSAESEAEAMRDSAPVHVGEKVWLPHKAGYAAARLLSYQKGEEEDDEGVPDGKCRVRVDYSGEELIVNDVLEKVLPPTLILSHPLFSPNSLPLPSFSS